MPNHEKINYIEMPSKDLEKTKAFFSSLFNWAFTDYGPEYCDFQNEGINGGFYKSDAVMTQEGGSALVVFYSDDLNTTYEKVKIAGGEISTEIFEFPGGKRFHFKDPNGCEYAVWTTL